MRLGMRSGIGLMAAALLLSATGCAGAQRMSASQAFALTASALSGRDRFEYVGEAAVYGGSGGLQERRAYKGVVAGHRPQAAAWSGGGGGSGSPEAAADPLGLVDALARQAASVEYEPAEQGDVRLRLVLGEQASRARAAKLLAARAQAAKPEARDAPAPTGWSEAELDRALRTLRATTVCRWTAHRRSWFPKELREDTEIAYERNGRQVRERTTVVTHFRELADGDTIK